MSTSTKSPYDLDPGRSIIIYEVAVMCQGEAIPPTPQGGTTVPVDLTFFISSDSKISSDDYRSVRMRCCGQQVSEDEVLWSTGQ